MSGVVHNPNIVGMSVYMFLNLVRCMTARVANIYTDLDIVWGSRYGWHQLKKIGRAHV